jgi:hypothetical protein
MAGLPAGQSVFARVRYVENLAWKAMWNNACVVIRRLRPQRLVRRRAFGFH